MITNLMWIKAGIGMALVGLVYTESYTTLVCIFLLFCLLCVLIYFNQNKLLYMPQILDEALSPAGNPKEYRHPSYQSLHTTDVQINTKDGLKIRGWLINVEGSDKLIIYFHQNAGNIGFRIPFIKSISAWLRVDVLLVAYRGFSDSQGTPTEQGIQLDAEAILNFAMQICKEPKKNLFVFGRSLGGAVGIYIASHPFYAKNIKGIIIENTFTSITDMIDQVMPFFKPFKFLSRNSWPSIQRVGKMQMPVLYIRSLKDQLVPTSQMQRLITNTTASIRVSEFTIPDGTHNVSWSLDQRNYFTQIKQFLNFN